MSLAPESCTAFEGERRMASGSRQDVALAVKAAIERGGSTPVLTFDDATGQLVDFDLRGTAEDIVARLKEGGRADDSAQTVRRPGRPKLGVVSREVTLLPRHWDWLNNQPGGASVALRRLVDAARTANNVRDQVRQAQEACDRFMMALAGNQPGYEDAARALYARNKAKFAELTAAWPTDVGDHARRLASPSFATDEQQG